jgi:CBS domain-containing protein
VELIMERPSYKPLAQAAISHTGCYVLDAHNPLPVRADSPALEVMTDLSKIPAATVSPDEMLPEANQSMLLRGVRLLLVASNDGRVRGVITTNDLLGEKPVLVAQNRGIKRNELRVSDVMTAVDHMEVMRLSDVAKAEARPKSVISSPHSRRRRGCMRLWLKSATASRCCAVSSLLRRLRGNSGSV